MLLLMVLLILMRVLLHEVLLQIRPYMLRLHELCGEEVAAPLVASESLKRCPKWRHLEKLEISI